MIEVTILWDDGAMFLVALPRDQFDGAEAVEEVYDQLSRGAVIHGRWLTSDGTPQEQFRLVRFYERGIRAVTVDL